VTRINCRIPYRFAARPVAVSLVGWTLLLPTEATSVTKAVRTWAGSDGQASTMRANSERLQIDAGENCCAFCCAPDVEGNGKMLQVVAAQALPSFSLLGNAGTENPCVGGSIPPLTTSQVAATLRIPPQLLGFLDSPPKSVPVSPFNFPVLRRDARLYCCAFLFTANDVDARHSIKQLICDLKIMPGRYQLTMSNPSTHRVLRNRHRHLRFAASS